jgi:amino acid transporter
MVPIEDNFIFVCPEFVNIVLLSTGIFQMFKGIEIDHPVFNILFLNLIITLVSSLINILAFPLPFPLPNNVKYSTIVNATNGLTMLFHCCCWAIVSALRYLYTIKKNWLEEHYPDQKQIKYLSTILLACLYIFCAGTELTVVTMFGWPSYKIFETKYFQILISVSTVLGIYIGLLGISFVFYILILCQRKNKVIHFEEPVKMSSIGVDENNYGGIWIGENTMDSPKSDFLTKCQVRKYKFHFKPKFL